MQLMQAVNLLLYLGTFSGMSSEGVACRPSAHYLARFIGKIVEGLEVRAEHFEHSAGHSERTGRTAKPSLARPSARRFHCR